MNEIYLCDDETVWMDRIEKAIDGYQLESNLAFHIACRTASPKLLLKYLKEHEPIIGGIFFLDIDLKDTMTGLELATQIRDSYPGADIVFVTTHEELALETFRLKLAVLDYIIKDTEPLASQITNTLKTIETRYRSQASPSAPLLIRKGDIYEAIHPGEIYYIETIKEAHKICIHLKSEMHRIPGSISSIKEQLDDEFYQCHKTCLVNLRHIKQIFPQEGQILLDNGEVCFCSVRGCKSLLKVLPVYHRKNV